MTHYNQPWQLPIVDAYIVILVGDIEHRVKRKSYVSNKDDILLYFKEDGTTIEGKFLWRHT